MVERKRRVRLGAAAELAVAIILIALPRYNPKRAALKGPRYRVGVFGDAVTPACFTPAFLARRP